MTIVIDRGDDLRVVGHLYREGCSAVESLLDGEHTGSAIGEGCQLEGVLVGLGTRVDEEELIILITADLAQTLC